MDYPAIIIGLGSTLAVSSVILGSIFYFLPVWLSQDRPSKSDLWLSALVGIIERIIYFFSAYFGVYEFLAGWLVLKSVANFNKEDSSPFLRTYYVYLLGTGLSLLFGVGGAVLTRDLCGLPPVPEQVVESNR
ncbi:hypothetical protein [Marinobacter lipolyticus]|uniref:hypothetical protein n=1 Tax=Marinobacter lipolyticus TaxID=209639 RepID=UPI003A8FF8FA